MKRAIATTASALALAGVAFLESLRQRGRALEAEQSVRLLMLMAQLPDGTWEVCPECEGEAYGCMTCWEAGFVEHFAHDEEEI